MVDFDRLRLKFNPFEPSASGAPVAGPPWLPESWQQEVDRLLNLLQDAETVKALAITGEYGGGKTYVLQWLHGHELPQRRIKSYYFDNTGVQFYDLANALLRQIGRKEFAKSLWELAGIHVGGYQRSLFADGFEEYLRGRARGKVQSEAASQLQVAILNAGITRDEEIAHRLARIVTDTPSRPYFEYSDFVAGKRDALVAEREEAPYFSAILRTLKLAAGIDKVAFLIDEFEEISLQKKLTRREAHDYLGTLKRLINLTREADLWVVLALTPDALDKTRMLEPSLVERFASDGTFRFSIPPLTTSEAQSLIRERIRLARSGDNEKSADLFPFPNNVTKIWRPATVSNPRRLVKVCFYSISSSRDEVLPFSEDLLRDIERQAFPA